MNRAQANNFVNAYMVGYLDKKSENWFKSWTEKFCVLTNVGLLYYDDPSKRPRNLFPSLTAAITPISVNSFNRKFVFKLKSFNTELILAAKSEDDYDNWMKGFNKLRDETEKKKARNHGRQRSQEGRRKR